MPFGGTASPVFENIHEIQLFSVVVVCIMVNLQLQLLKVFFTLFELSRIFYKSIQYHKNGGFWPL